MDVLISYDVDKNSQSIVKKALIAAGFKDILTNKRETYNLPNTTLVFEGLNTARLASAHFNRAIDNLNDQRPGNKKIKVTRFVACGISMSTGIEGDEHVEINESVDDTEYDEHVEIIESVDDTESEIATLTFSQKKDLCLLYLYNETKDKKFRGRIAVYDAFANNGIILEQKEINLIVNQLKTSKLIVSPDRGESIIHWDAFNKGIEFVENTSFVSPGESILSLY